MQEWNVSSFGWDIDRIHTILDYMMNVLSWLYLSVQFFPIDEMSGILIFACYSAEIALLYKSVLIDDIISTIP